MSISYSLACRRAWFWCLILLLVGLANKAVAQDRVVNDTRVTAADVQQALQNSPNASPQLLQYAQAVGSLAMYESGGQLSVYNGSCCYGVLQMNQTNIRVQTGLTPEQFRRLPLQDQVNAWASVMSQALTTHAPSLLSSMGTFDGRPVTPSMVLACVQLGVGNCLNMIRSGRCSGFADINGTTICAMADRIDNGMGSSPPVAVTPAPGSPTVTPIRPREPLSSCITDGQGRCISISQALSDGFEQGSGHSMQVLRTFIQGLTAVVTFLIAAGLMLGVWREHTSGRLATVDLVNGWRTTSMVVLIILVAMTVA